KDPRYAAFIGKCVRRPLPVENQALLPIIGDEHVDFTFGTGVLKVTPAHDKADFEIWERIVLIGMSKNDERLAMMKPIEVIAQDGRMNELAGAELAGLD